MKSLGFISPIPGRTVAASNNVAPARDVDLTKNEQANSNVERLETT